MPPSRPPVTLGCLLALAFGPADLPDPVDHSVPCPSVIAKCPVIKEDDLLYD